MKTSSILMLGRWSFVMAVIGLFSFPANATDLTLFAGMQHAGDLTVERRKAERQISRRILIETLLECSGFDSAMGRRSEANKMPEHAANFVSSDNHALIVHGNACVQIPIPVLKLYATGASASSTRR